MTEVVEENEAVWWRGGEEDGSKGSSAKASRKEFFTCARAIVLVCAGQAAPSHHYHQTRRCLGGAVATKSAATRVGTNTRASARHRFPLVCVCVRGSSRRVSFGRDFRKISQENAFVVTVRGLFRIVVPLWGVE